MRPYGGPSRSLKPGKPGKNAWISTSTWRLVNKRVSTCQDPTRYQALIGRLGRAINMIMKGERRRRTEKSGKEVKRLIVMDLPIHQEAWQRMKGCYLAAFYGASLPDWVTLERITA